MKKNILSILLLSNLIVFGVFLSSYIIEEQESEADPLFIVEYSLGKLWDSNKDFFDQKFAKHHSDYLSKLRASGMIRFGARYADKGIIFVSGKNIESVQKVIHADSAVINKLFTVRINDLDVFYEYGEMKKETATPVGRVTGIGGVFFKTNNPKAINNWYYENLGLIPNDYGSMFEWRGSDDHKIAYTQWSPFSSKTKYFNPSKAPYMINYRVDDLEALRKKLKANNVIILDTIESFEYGKFLHILDCDSNKVELWEPVDGSFTNLYKGKTTK